MTEIWPRRLVLATIIGAAVAAVVQVSHVRNKRWCLQCFSTASQEGLKLFEFEVALPFLGDETSESRIRTVYFPLQHQHQWTFQSTNEATLVGPRLSVCGKSIPYLVLLYEQKPAFRDYFEMFVSREKLSRQEGLRVLRYDEFDASPSSREERRVAEQYEKVIEDWPFSKVIEDSQFRAFQVDLASAGDYLLWWILFLSAFVAACVVAWLVHVRPPPMDGRRDS